MSGISKKISEGTYGCAYRPAIQRPGKPNCPTCITKAMSEGEFLKETAMNRKMLKIDPEGKGWCRQLDVDAIQVGEVDCIKAEPVNRIIQYEYGGTTLLKVINEPQKYDLRRLLYNMLLLYKQLVIYNSHGIYHRDIKPDNVVVDEHYHIRFIDFGLAIDVNEIKEGGMKAGMNFYYNYTYHLLE